MPFLILSGCALVFATLLIWTTYNNNANIDVLGLRLRFGWQRNRRKTRDNSLTDSSLFHTCEDKLPPPGSHGVAEYAKDHRGKSTKTSNSITSVFLGRTPSKKTCSENDNRAHLTATGFTAEEIRRLGDFPDYATLSGVPLPQCDADFDIRTAIPRPYRPLRWPYHQTMCKLP